MHHVLRTNASSRSCTLDQSLRMWLALVSDTPGFLDLKSCLRSVCIYTFASWLADARIEGALWYTRVCS